jgi:hypothetical protein
MSVRTLAELQAICFTWYPISPIRDPLEEIMSLEQQVNFALRDATRIIGDLQPVVGPKPSTGGVRYGVPSQSAAESKVFVRFGQWDKMTTMQPTFGVDHIASPLQTGRC